MEKIKQYLEEGGLSEQVDGLFGQVIEKPEVAEALSLLDDLPEGLTYHNKDHTLNVLKKVILLAVMAEEPADVVEKQAIAAAWHDVGYVQQRKDNESIAVDMFKKSEAYKGLSESDREEIIANILDTQMKLKDGEPFFEKKYSQHAYILDADTSNFGRDTFFSRSESVAKEEGIDLDDPEAARDFWRFTLKLLKNHSWKTPEAANLWQETKENNIKKVKEILESLE